MKTEGGFSRWEEWDGRYGRGYGTVTYPRSRFFAIEVQPSEKQGHANESIQLMKSTDISRLAYPTYPSESGLGS